MFFRTAKKLTDDSIMYFRIIIKQQYSRGQKGLGMAHEKIAQKPASPMSDDDVVVLVR